MSTASAIAKKFIAYLKEEQQYAELPEISQLLQEEVLRNQDISVIVAAELPEADQKSITKELVSKWGEHRVVFTVDSTILSGMIVRFQDNIIDLSGRRSLSDLRTALTNPS